MAAVDTMLRRDAYKVGAGLTMMATGFLLLPGSERFSSPGPLLHGHQDLACAACHTPGTPGSGVNPLRVAGNEGCLSCHRNAWDLHPVHRFDAATFASARATLAPHLCSSCHREHTGRRVTGVTPQFCSQCHQNVSPPNDPIRPRHVDLTAASDWSACLLCHDYHGAHLRQTPHRLPENITEQNVLDYFDRGPALYGDGCVRVQSRGHP